MGRHGEIRPDKLVMWHTEQHNALSDEACLICLTQKEIYLLGQALRQMTWETRWRVADGDTLPDIDALSSSLEVKLMTCNVYQLRMSPTVSCQVEQSFDAGENWIDAFNLRDCITDVVEPIVTSQGDWLLQELLDKWDGTAESITKNLTYDGSDDDDFRDIALCNALQMFVDAMSEAELDRRFKSIQIWEDVPEILVAIGAVLWVTPIPGARVVAFGLALAAAAMEVGLPAWGVISQIDLENETERDRVACEMYDNLKGATPTFSAFQTCLDNHPFFMWSAAWNIALGVTPMIQELEVFVTFLQIWDNVFPMAAGGFLDVCDCPDEGWVVEFLGGAGRPPNWSFVANTPFDLAKYNSPGDYWYADDTPSQPESSAFCTIEFFIDDTFDLDWIMWDIDLTSTSGNAYDSGQQEWLYNDVGGLIAQHNNPGYHKNNTPATVGWDTTQVDIKTVRLQARIYDPANNEDTMAKLSRITIKGTGTIPPEWEAFEV